MYDVMKSSQGNRENPLSIVITTAGFNLFSPCYQLRQTNIEILSGMKQDDTVFCAIYTLDEGDDWKDENNFIKSNPNIGISVKEQYLKEQVTQALNNTSLEVGVRTKNFNQWCSSSDIWLNNDLLLENSKNLKIDDFKESVAYVGVDLAAVSDMTAVSYMIPKDGKFYFFTDYYLPSSCLQDNSNSELYKEWKRKGLLKITDGNVTDYDNVLSDILKKNNVIFISKIAYDSYNATQWAINATSAGLPLEPFSQALWNFNKPTKTFEILLKQGKVIRKGKIVIDMNPCVRWCFNNVELKYDHNENVKPVKQQAQQKIDGVISILEALGTYLEEPIYDNVIDVI